MGTSTVFLSSGCFSNIGAMEKKCVALRKRAPPAEFGNLFEWENISAPGRFFSAFDKVLRPGYR
jgi:hypothetical protein